MEYPTVFYGVAWDDGWEFDMPCVVYKPVFLYQPSGNSGGIEHLVEDYCIDLCTGGKPKIGLTAFEKKELAWRHWSLQGFAKRKKAWHTVIEVDWFKDQDGRQLFKFTNVTERWGGAK